MCSCNPIASPSLFYYTPHHTFRVTLFKYSRKRDIFIVTYTAGKRARAGGRIARESGSGIWYDSAQQAGLTTIRVASILYTWIFPTLQMLVSAGEGQPRPFRQIIVTQRKEGISLVDANQVCNDLLHMTSTSTTHSRSFGNHQHAQLKRIYALRTREERQRSGLYYVEGLRFIAQAVQHHIPIETLVTCHPLLNHPFAHRLIQQQKRSGTPIIEVPACVFRDLSRAKEPQGIGAVVQQRWERLEQIRPGSELCWIALQAVQTPGNLGTILRTAEAVGAT